MTRAERAAIQIPEHFVAAWTGGHCATPHAFLGAHGARIGRRDGVIVRVTHPTASAAWLLPVVDETDAVTAPIALHPLDVDGCFGVFLPDAAVPLRYRVRWQFADGHHHDVGDAYRHWPTLGDQDLHLFNEGQHFDVWRVLGAHPRVHDGDAGTAFAVWAPNALRVSVVGDFCGWDGRVYPMRAMGASGVFELFIPGVGLGALYQFEILTRDGRVLHKADPFANLCEVPPGRASRVWTAEDYTWRDHRWMTERAHTDARARPMHVYEVHLGSWRRHADGRSLSYRELAYPLVQHALHFGFTHIELLPISEHPFEGSWGYQVTGFYAPTSRLGTPDDFRYLVDVCHAHGIGVIMDWVPAHFPRDAFALARFDGTALFEHADPLRAEHPDWGTYIFNYGRNEVRNFLIGSALYWLQEMHVDGLRVDAVASMLYRDYSRAADQWVPNEHGGREDLEAVAFLRALNRAVATYAPGGFTIAEESTSWPGVTAPLEHGGLGFTFKWNMGWMHDTLRYFGRDPIHRRHHQDDLTFAMLYEHSEHFVNALSHDEVVHGKGSLLRKMAGDHWQQFANLRALHGYQMLRPGKKLTFMGAEFAMATEWDHNVGLPEVAEDDHARHGFSRFVAELGGLYRAHPCLWQSVPELSSFQWIDTRDHEQSVLSFTRHSGRQLLIVVLNLTPAPRHDYRVGVPRAGRYQTLLNSDDLRFGGSGLAIASEVQTDPIGMHDHGQSLALSLPPLSVLVLLATAGSDAEQLRDDADRSGIFCDYFSMDGAHHVTSDATRAALLSALGQARHALHASLLEPTRVLEQACYAAETVTVRVPEAGIAQADVVLQVTSERGDSWTHNGSYRAPACAAYFRLPRLGELPLGHHQLRLDLTWRYLDGRCVSQSLSQALIVTPRRAHGLPGDVDQQRHGLWLALYSLVSERNWGIGDVGDLRALIPWAAAEGMAFLGINPLHASVLPCQPMSPYFPTTRLYRSEMYLDIEAIPELHQCPDARALVASAAFQQRLHACRVASRVDYAAVHQLKWPVVQQLARHFITHEREADTERGRSYRKYAQDHRDTLGAYATFMTLADHFQQVSFHDWPAAYRDPHSVEVAEFVAAHGDAIAAHQYAQFELDRQLADAAELARASGMEVGLYLDLAVGSQHGGFDAWLWPHLFAEGVNLGAPPDALGPDGQDWGLCPLRPHAQMLDGYVFVRTLLEHNMQHAGALRIDHVLGLTRQYWVPHGQRAPGTYIAFPLEHWLGVISAQSVQQRCVVIGEDLGTVPHGLREALAAYGVYGCRVLHFEIDADHPAPDERTAVMASLNSHDLSPFAGYLRGHDIHLRERLGLLTTERAREQRVVRQRRLEHWATRLRQEGWLARADDAEDVRTMLIATHRALRATDAAMCAFSLDDLVAETVPLNVPGVTQTERYEPWTRRMGVSLESIVADPEIIAHLASIRSARRPRGD